MFTDSLTLSRAAAPRAALRAARPARGRLAVQANTLWSLTPDKAWCKANPKACTALAPLDLTGAIGIKRLVSVGTADFGSSHDECIDFTVLDHGGIHIQFEAEGESNPLDSPSVLYITDVDSECEVRVNGEVLQKGVKTRVKPGAVVQCGSDVAYQVLRNVFAHA